MKRFAIADSVLAVVFASASLCVLFAPPVFGQESPDQTKFLGITYDQFRLAYPSDCKTLRAAEYADGSKDLSLEKCAVKHHPKELVPGSKIIGEVAFFKDRRVIELHFFVKHGADWGLRQLYGPPDPPVKMDSSYAFGKAIFGYENSSTTLDGAGESHFNLSQWTRPGFKIEWELSSYMSWDDMVERDTTVAGSLAIRPLAFEKVTFLLRPAELPEGLRQSIAANSEASMSTPAAAAGAADLGHLPTPEEIAALVREGKASKCVIITDPPGAGIYIDGNSAGVSPVVLTLLKMGDSPRAITIKMDGYRTIEKSVVPDGGTIPIGLVLEKAAR